MITWNNIIISIRQEYLISYNREQQQKTTKSNTKNVNINVQCMQFPNL